MLDHVLEVVGLLLAAFAAFFCRRGGPLLDAGEPSGRGDRRARNECAQGSQEGALTDPCRSRPAVSRGPIAHGGIARIATSIKSPRNYVSALLRSS